MFTGIITQIGEITHITPKKDALTIEVKAGYNPETVDIGASIACDGMCLTLTHKQTNEEGGIFRFDLSKETLMKTTAQDWYIGRKINLERALAAGDEFGGHMVSGHVDTVTTILSREDDEHATKFQIETPADFAPYIASKGSITLNGTSLTVNAVFNDYFEIMLIPHSLTHTTWGNIRAKEKINLEIDSFARYVSHYVDHILAQKGLIS